MNYNRNRPGPVFRTTFFLVALLVAVPALASSVTVRSPLGDIVIELFEDAAPETVANFLNYVDDGDYQDSFIHRSVPGFVIQGGGFSFVDDTVVEVPTDPPVINEPGISNLRGTVAMAKRSGDENSATSQWFINTADNASQLDGQNGGFTVFGEVVSGMDVVDAIADLPIWNAGGAFAELPLINYPGEGAVERQHLVITELVRNSDFTINAGVNDAWFNPETNGQGFFIVVYPDIETMFLSWFTFDTERPDPSVTAQLGEPGHRWLTALGSFSGNQAVLDVSVTAGGVFDSGEPAPMVSADGTIIVEFADCQSGTVSYDIPSIGQQGEIPIQRVAPDNVALCQQLAGQ